MKIRLTLLLTLLSLLVAGCGKDYISRPEVPAAAPSDSSGCGDEDDKR